MHPELSTALHLEHLEMLPVNRSTDSQGNSVLWVALSTKGVCKEVNLLRTVGKRQMHKSQKVLEFEEFLMVRPHLFLE